MFILFLWLLLAALAYGVARGLADGFQLTGIPLTTVWLVTFGIYGGGLAYCDPAAKMQQESSAAVSDEDRSLMGAALLACDDRARQSANIPRTVDFKAMQTAREVIDGSARVRRGFSAENAFGQTLDFVYHCSYRSGQITSFNIYR